MVARDTPSRFVGLADAYNRLSAGFHVPIVALILLISTLLVVLAGGPPSAIIQIFFAPVLLAAMRYHFRGGVLCGALAGLLAGPVAYLLTPSLALAAVSPAIGLHWAFRIGWMTVIGGSIGAALGYARSRADALEFHLSTDPATNMPNLEAARQYALGLAHDLALNGPASQITKCAIRVTNYQSIVNAFGHHFADEAMARIAETLRREVSEGVYLARVARATFALISPGDKESHSARAADLLARLQRASCLVENVPLYLNFVMGLASVDTKGFNVEHLFADAETTVTEAELSGTSVALHDPLRSNHQRDHVRLLGEIDSAMRSGQLLLVYQPRLCLNSGRISGVEALARWKHPERGWVSPADFVPLVERTRFIDTFTQWVLNEGLRQLAEWRDLGHNVSMSLNVSANNLIDGWLPDYTIDLLERLGIPPSAIELEITESSFLKVTEEKLELLRTLRTTGAHIAIDDFGTGYASLAYLRQLPVDLLKLDRSFVQNDPGEPRDELMVRRIVQMAKDRELLVVAEGVESAESLKAVRRLGCDEAQGYFIAKPLLPDRVPQQFRKVWNTKAV